MPTLAPSRISASARLAAVGGLPPPDLRAVDPVEVFQGHLQHLRPATLEQAGRVTQLQPHTNLVALDVHFTQTTGADRVLVEVGIGVLRQCSFDRCAGNGHIRLPGKDRAEQADMIAAAASDTDQPPGMQAFFLSLLACSLPLPL